VKGKQESVLATAVDQVPSLVESLEENVGQVPNRVRRVKIEWALSDSVARLGGFATKTVFRSWMSRQTSFVEPEELITLLHDLATRVGTASDEHEYGQNKVVWFEGGKRVLDYIEAEEHAKPGKCV
jgi:hypothetical protein